MFRSLALGIFLLSSVFAVYSQSKDAAIDKASIEKEIRAFYAAYDDDMQNSRGAALIDRYDPRGAYALGNGVKTFQTPEFLKRKYLSFKAPKHFAWKALEVDVLTADTVAVLGLFEWQFPTGPIHTYSYTGILVKRNGKWLIRVEDESRPVNPPPVTTN